MLPANMHKSFAKHQTIEMFPGELYRQDDINFMQSNGTNMQNPQNKGHPCLLPQYLLHRLSFCQFIDQFIHIADLLHERIFDLFYTIATDHTGDL